MCLLLGFCGREEERDLTKKKKKEERESEKEINKKIKCLCEGKNKKIDIGCIVKLCVKID